MTRGHFTIHREYDGSEFETSRARRFTSIVAGVCFLIGIGAVAGMLIAKAWL